MALPRSDSVAPGCQSRRSVAQELYVYVDDVDAHYARAKRAGATILEEPTDQFYGDRRYRAADPEGHHWCFATHVRDVSAEEMRGSG
jgi:uncharacterized glyoxalase superfamily protein PhnB